jgi:orotate phosphoribosyltransferase
MPIEMQEELQQMLRDSGAHLEGHFKLSSGLHSGHYLQCALLLRFPRYAAFAGKALAEKIKPLRPDIIVSPALGGMIIGHEVARALDLPFLFCERQEGKMRLRRFPHPGKVRMVIIEDVITTGGSTLEVKEVMEQQGTICAGMGCIIDRSGGTHLLPKDPLSLWMVNFETWTQDKCPLCASGTPAVKPGSRN